MILYPHYLYSVASVMFLDIDTISPPWPFPPPKSNRGWGIKRCFFFCDPNKNLEILEDHSIIFFPGWILLVCIFLGVLFSLDWNPSFAGFQLPLLLGWARLGPGRGESSPSNAFDSFPSSFHGERLSVSVKTTNISLLRST